MKWTARFLKVGSVISEGGSQILNGGNQVSEEAARFRRVAERL
jgi:hypothetical protein